MTEYLFRGGPRNGEMVDVPLQGRRLPTTVYVMNPADLDALRSDWVEDLSAVTPTMTSPIKYTRERLTGGVIEYWTADYRATRLRPAMTVEQRLAILERELAATKSQIERLSQ